MRVSQKCKAFPVVCVFAAIAGCSARYPSASVGVSQPSTPVVEVDFKRLARMPQAERIHLLVASLSQVTGRKPNVLTTILTSDPVVGAIVHEGDPSVPALIDAIASDERLSNAVLELSPFLGGGTRPLTVKEVAWDTLQKIWPSVAALQVSVPQKDIQEIAPRPEVLRAKWKDVSHFSNETRWLQVLRDDKSSQDAWIRAVKALMSPVDMLLMWGVSYDDVAKSARAGARLTRVEKVEFGQLMRRRAIQVVDESHPSRIASTHFGGALVICNALYRWEPSRCAPTLRKVCDVILRMAAKRHSLSEASGNSGLQDAEAEAFLGLISKRAIVGDSTAAADYQRFLRFRDSQNASESLVLLRPYWECPQDLAIQRIAESRLRIWFRMFSSRDPAIARSAIGELSGANTYLSLLSQSAFRRLLIAVLQNHVKIASFKITTQDGRATCDFNPSHNGLREETLDSTEFPQWKPGMVGQVACCDYMANVLTSDWSKGMPKFNLMMGDRQRANARSALIAWLSKDKLDWNAIKKTAGWSIQEPIDVIP